jgi:hypothetical protein
VDALKLALVLALIVVALRRRWPVGVVLFGAGVLTAALFLVSPMELLGGYADLVQSRRFISLTAVIVLITTLGQMLQELGLLQRMSDVCRDLPGGNRTAAAMLPPLIGLMPMPGGALLSAPLIERVIGGQTHPPAFKTATNYWFRHVVEFFWPVYPGIILTEAITGMPIGRVALMQAPMALVMTAIGWAFFIRRIPATAHEGHYHLAAALAGILRAVWPILLAILLYGALRIEMSIAVLVALLSLIAAFRPEWPGLKSALAKGFSFKLIFLVFGILSFQTALELSGAIGSLPQLTATLNLPPESVIVIVCFTAGLLTGMVAAFVALSYTILAGFLYQPDIIPSHIFLAYMAGYAGMMLSPGHVCLILTNHYFQSDLARVYRLLAVPVILLALSGAGLYLTGWGGLFR